MIRRNFLVLAASSALILPGLLQAQNRSAAGTVQATAAQIDELLRGNTITGTWGNSTYTQYFDASGFTVYIADGRPPSRGKWRVKEDTDQYDSWWENTGWTAYTVVMTNKGYAWVNGDTLEYFQVLDGKQADF